MAMLDEKTVLVTGGCGFIGSTFLLRAVPQFPRTLFINLDCLSYAANPSNLNSINMLSNYRFEKADLRNYQETADVFARFSPDLVVHFAAESHVDRSIFGPRVFIDTNIIGTVNLLENCRFEWKTPEGHLFYQVSTDEVYGSLGDKGFFSESTAYNPNSPYAASKAASDHLVRAYFHTYGLPVVITNSSNNYGPRQFPEKLIPLMIINCIERKPLPIYGDGSNIRDWLFVEDHCEAILRVLLSGSTGETFNIGGNQELSNLQVAKEICRIVAEETGCSRQELESLIHFVKDRAGHDWRYAINAEKIRRQLQWEPQESFQSGLLKTVRWYLENKAWVENVRTGEYQQWIKKNYDDR